ncbi:MAG: O-antigen ligase domain-containing protein [Cyanobacteria bacterium P01_F01_bin.150]
MTPFVPLMLFAWLPIIVFLFRWLPPHRAVLIAFLGGFLFLPQHSYPLPVLPDYDRSTATCYGVIIGMLLFDIDRLRHLKLGWIDLPMVVWCLCPFATSISNDLGAYDGLLAMLKQISVWGLPYILGRMYFNSLDGMRQLAVGIFMGGLVYIPLCFYETVMSPQLHRMLYGFHQHSFAQTVRYDGYRPMVFLQHGLMVGSWMMSAGLIGIWLWRSKTIESVLGIPMKWLVIAQCTMVVLVKSTGAWILMLLGLGVMYFSKWYRVAILVWLLVLAVPPYLYFSASGDMRTDAVVEFISENINPDRAQSLRFRFNNEEPLARKARERWIFGWGGWARAAIYSKYDGSQQSVSDSLWIVAYGAFGTVGLVSLTATLLFPSIGFLISYSAANWAHKRLAPVSAIMIILVLYTLDNLLNDMKIPLYILGMGGLSGLLTKDSSKEQGIDISVSQRFLE